MKDLPAASKIDVIARNILTIFPRKKSTLKIEYYAFFSKITPLLLKVTRINPLEEVLDEISVASILKEELEKEPKKFACEIKDEPPISFSRVEDLDLLLNCFMVRNFSIYYLHETGLPLDNHLNTLLLSPFLLFILGGRNDISPENEMVILKTTREKITLGSNSYLASTCILKIIYELEKKNQCFF